MSSKLLFDNDLEYEDNVSGFNTNKEYAKTYNMFRSKELMKKLKDKNQSGHASSSSDDSNSDTDTDNDTVDPKFNEAFYCALATLKKKDSSTYDANVKFFDEFDSGKVNDEKKTTKALTVKDYERKILLEKGGIYEDSDSENGINKRSTSSYNQEQIHIKEELKKVIEEHESDDNNEWGGIFRKRVKTKEEEVDDEEQYIKWLAGEETNIGENAQKLKPLKEYWNNPKLSKSEKYLRDYILSNGYNRSDKKDIPTYDEIIGDDQMELSEDEAELERQAEFEQKFNFRFEEPDSEFIKRYPRTIENSVRREDNRRKMKRVEVKVRKINEKKEKMRELEVINAVKKKEIEEKIQKLKEVTGNEFLPFEEADINADFDPDVYDRKMKEIFNNEYYQVDEGETKPDCPDIEDLKVEDWDNYDPTKDDDYDSNKGAHCEDDNFIMDCEYDPEQKKQSFQDELVENTRDKRKRRKRRSKFIEMLKTEKPVFNPDDEKTYGQYLDEYFNLDYEDIIGDTPCRFKYVETVPNDFGLTVEEILLAKNKELNQWASLKKATQIRPEHVELNEINTYKNRARNEYLKRKILPSLYQEGAEGEDVDDEIAGEKYKSLERGKKKTNEKTLEYNVDEVVNESAIQKDHNKKVKNKKSPLRNESSKNPNDGNEPQKNMMKKGAADFTESAVKALNFFSDSQKKKKEKKLVVKSNRTSKQKNKNTSKNVSTKKNLLHGTIKKNTKKLEKTKNSTSTRMYPSKTSISDERLRAFGLNPKKFHKKLKYGNKSAGTEITVININKIENKVSKTDKLNKKKNKRKLQTILRK